MSDDSKILNPKSRQVDQLNLDEALMELQQARSPLIDQTRRTGEKPSSWDLLSTGIPEQIKVWYNSGSMAPTAPNGERSYFREQADKSFEQQLQDVLNGQHQKPHGWKLK